MARPFWSGQIQISLVSFGVDLFSATETKSAIHFHQLSRKTGERIKHQKVSGEEGPVENADIVKGYEVSKGEYVAIEPSEIENLRIPSRRTLEVTQFVDSNDLNPELFEKPYFVVPENESQAAAFAVVRKALEETHKVALGKIAFGGREHLVAVASTADDKLPGMMAYTLRYAEELRNPADYFANIKQVSIEEEQLSLAKELIKRKAAKFDAGQIYRRVRGCSSPVGRSQSTACAHSRTRARPKDHSYQPDGRSQKKHSGRPGRSPEEEGSRQGRCCGRREKGHRADKGRQGSQIGVSCRGFLISFLTWKLFASGISGRTLDEDDAEPGKQNDSSPRSAYPNVGQHQAHDSQPDQDGEGEFTIVHKESEDFAKNVFDPAHCALLLHLRLEIQTAAVARVAGRQSETRTSPRIR